MSVPVQLGDREITLARSGDRLRDALIVLVYLAAAGVLLVVYGTARLLAALLGVAG